MHVSCIYFVIAFQRRVSKRVEEKANVNKSTQKENGVEHLKTTNILLKHDLLKTEFKSQ